MYDHGVGPDALIGFAKLSSEFYPQLEMWSLEEVREWCEAKIAIMEDE